MTFIMSIKAHGVHGMVNPAAEIITTRLEEAEAELKEATNHNAAAQQDLHDWETGFCEENGREPTRKDRWAWCYKFKEMNC